MVAYAANTAQTATGDVASSQQSKAPCKSRTERTTNVITTDDSDALDAILNASKLIKAVRRSTGVISVG